MNEEMNYEETVEETTVVDTEDCDDENELVESEKTSNGLGSAVLTVTLVAGAGYLIGKGIEKGGKALVGFVKNRMARKKVEPDEDGCVCEAEAQEVDESMESENCEQEDDHKKRKKR